MRSRGQALLSMSLKNYHDDENPFKTHRQFRGENETANYFHTRIGLFVLEDSDGRCRCQTRKLAKKSTGSKQTKSRKARRNVSTARYTCGRREITCTT